MTIRPPAAYCLNEEIARGRCKKFASELAYCWRQHSEVSMMMAEVPISRPTPPRPEDYVVGARDATFALASACAIRFNEAEARTPRMRPPMSRGKRLS